MCLKGLKRAMRKKPTRQKNLSSKFRALKILMAKFELIWFSKSKNISINIKIKHRLGLQ